VRILAVDDDQDFLETLTLQLTDLGFEVTGASSGAEALSALEKAEFDVVLLDVMMPHMSGDEVARRIRGRRRTRGIPIVLLTCLTDARAISDSILSGANYYISKTAPPEMMSEVVREAIRLGKEEAAAFGRA
jgi:two-component system sensor histidine kinase ChiS